MTELEKTEFKIKAEQVRKGITDLIHSFNLSQDALIALGAVRVKLDSAMREATK